MLASPSIILNAGGKSIMVSTAYIIKDTLNFSFRDGPNRSDRVLSRLEEVIYEGIYLLLIYGIDAGHNFINASNPLCIDGFTGETQHTAG